MRLQVDSVPKTTPKSCNTNIVTAIDARERTTEPYVLLLLGNFIHKLSAEIFMYVRFNGAQTHTHTCLLARDELNHLNLPLKQQQQNAKRNFRAKPESHRITQRKVSIFLMYIDIFT